MIIQDLFESPQICPECGGPSFSDLILAEKKDACYHKVKASAKVWPSAYASGRLVQCRKKGADNYGNSKNEGVAEAQLDEKCWDGYQQQGMKNKSGRQVPNCVPAESVNEMDKSQTPPGRDGINDSDAGKKEYTATLTNQGAVARQGSDILNKAFIDSQRVDPRTGKKMNTKGVAEEYELAGVNVAYELGRRAYKQGMTIRDNPYSATKEARKNDEWEKGLERGKHDANAARHFRGSVREQAVAEGLAQDEAEEYSGWRAEFVNEINYNTFEVKLTNTRSKESANFIVRPVDMVSYGPTLSIETMDVHDLQTGQTESWTNDDPAPDGPIAYAISGLFYDDKQLQKKLQNIIDTHDTKGQDMMPGMEKRRSIGQEVDADAYIDSQEKTQAAMAKMKKGVAEKLGDNRPKLGSKRDAGKSIRKWRSARGLDETGVAETMATFSAKASTRNSGSGEFRGVSIPSDMKHPEWREPTWSFQEIAQKLGIPVATLNLLAFNRIGGFPEALSGLSARHGSKKYYKQSEVKRWVNANNVREKLKQGVAEADDSNFVGFMNKTLADKVDSPKADPIAGAPDFYRNAAVSTLDGRQGFKNALKFGLKALSRLDPETRQQLAAGSEQAVANYLTDVAERSGQMGDDTFVEEDISEVQDYLSDVFHDPSINSWKDVLQQSRTMSESQLDEKSVSQAQFRTMAAAAHNPKFAKKVGIKQSVAKEFNQADKGSNYKKLPDRTTEGSLKETDTSRRGFLRGLAAFAASAAVPAPVVKLLSTPAGVASLPIPAGIALLKGIQEHLDQWDPEDDDDYYEAWEDMAGELGFEDEDAGDEYGESAQDQLADIVNLYRENPELAAAQLIKHLQTNLGVSAKEINPSFASRADNPNDWRYHDKQQGATGTSKKDAELANLTRLAAAAQSAANARLQQSAAAATVKHMGPVQYAKDIPALPAPTKPEFDLAPNLKQKEKVPVSQQYKKDNQQGMDEGEQQKGADYRDPPEADYGDDYQAMVARMKKLAGLGPLKTVYDPAKRVYRNVPTAVQPKK